MMETSAEMIDRLDEFIYYFFHHSVPSTLVSDYLIHVQREFMVISFFFLQAKIDKVEMR